MREAIPSVGIWQRSPWSLFHISRPDTFSAEEEMKLFNVVNNVPNIPFLANSKYYPFAILAGIAVQYKPNSCLCTSVPFDSVPFDLEKDFGAMTEKTKRFQICAHRRAD